MNKKVCVLGGGSWGTAVATVLAANGYTVLLWCFEQNVVDEIVTFRINKKYLPGIELHENIQPTESLHDALTNTQIIFEAIPVLFLREVLKQVKHYVAKESAWVLLSKGIENQTLMFPSQVLEDVFGYTPLIAAVGGPNFADQVAYQKETATVVASRDQAFGKQVAQFLVNKKFKPYFSSDLIGVQVGGALKNVLAVLLGILKGAGYHTNLSACLFARGLAEIVSVAKTYGGRPETLYGLSGLGDMMLSASGEGGRNFKIGEMIGQGNTLADLETVMKVLPEGINTIKSLHKIIQKKDLRLPLCTAVYNIVFEGFSIRTFVDEYMCRPIETE